MNFKVKIKTNLWSGIIMGIFSAAMLFATPSQVRMPAYDSGAPSPRIMPVIVLSGILLASLFLIFQSLVLKKEKIYEFDLQHELPSILIIGLLCLFTFLILKIGFVLAVIITFPILLFYFGERKPFIYIFTLALGIGIYYLFLLIFHISLPSFPGFGG
ncbi:MAG: tripartite tricarboxylate transporter TctB family protein [Lawsonibacter sp.]